jgi:GT2 family glycosyltransferase
VLDASDADLRGRASIVIPVYNAVFYTRVCLCSLDGEVGDAEVIVVDNGSTDATPEVCTKWAEGSRRVYQRHDQQLGFARACNAGAAVADGEFIVFLNNDTFVLDDWLGALLRPFADPSVMVTGSRLLYPSGHVQHAGVAFNDLGPHHMFVGIPGDSPVVLVERDLQVVTGASLAIRRSEFDRLGGFDTSYENSFEDVDLCLKVRRDGGRVVYVPGSVAYHFESVTEGRLGPSDKRNYQLFMDRWSGVFDRDVPGLEAEAAAMGVDLAKDRVPARREIIDAEERRGAEHRELNELRHLARMRSVRAAVWARNTFRRVIPRQD